MFEILVLGLGSWVVTQDLTQDLGWVYPIPIFDSTLYGTTTAKLLISEFVKGHGKGVIERHETEL